VYAARVLVGRLVLLVGLLPLGGCGRVGIQLLLDAAVDDGGLLPDGGAPLDDGSAPPPLDAGDDSSLAEAGVDSATTDAALTDAATDTAVPCADQDADGICTAVDNCPSVQNPAQADLDADRIGDLCDDSDGDGVLDLSDPCPQDNPNDPDGDGVCSSVDGCPTDPSKQAPGVCGCNVTPPAGLVANWALDETAGSTALDVVAARNGTLSNFAGNPWAAGRFGNALSFDGNNDIVNVGGVTTTLRAISFWVRPTAFATVTNNTGWLSPTANGDPNNGWMDATNAYVSDDNYTNAGLLNDINNDFHGFGIQIPTSASILGIDVEVEMKTGNPTGTFGVELSWNRGGNYTNTGRQAPLVTSDQYWPFGGATDLWGHSFRPADMGDATFRVALSKQGINFSPMTPGVDHLRVRVHHTAAALNRALFDLGGGPRIELSASGVVLTGFPNGSAIYVDGVSGSVLDTNWHHVVITTLSNVSVPAFAMGGAPGYNYSFAGLIDDVKVFTQVPTAADRTTLSLSPSCR
jgi:hypothetical protein